MIEILRPHNTHIIPGHIMTTKAPNRVTCGPEAELRERKGSGSTLFQETPDPAARGAVNMGILAIAMIFGASTAAGALIAGQSFLMALAIYSGCGVLGIGMLIAVYMIGDAARSRKGPPLSQSNMAA